MKNGVKGIYSCLVINRNIPKCLNKWSKELNTEIDVKEIFDKKINKQIQMPHASDGFSINCYTDSSPLDIFYI